MSNLLPCNFEGYSFAFNNYLEPFNLTPRPRTKGEKAVLLALFVISGLALLGIGVFYVLNPRHIVGDQLVNNPNGTPAEFPSPSISPIYVKPITILFISGVIFTYCFFALALNWITKYVPRWIRYLFLVASVTLLAMGLYEILFNFTLWGAMLTSGAAPNTLVNPYPVGKVQTNLVYATKATLLWGIVTLISAISFKASLDSEKY